MLKPEKNAASSPGVRSDDHHPRPFVVGACWCLTSLLLAKGILSTPLQQWEGADQVWDEVQVVVAITWEWAVKPRGHRFMGHLLFFKVKVQGSKTTLAFCCSTVQGEPWTSIVPQSLKWCDLRRRLSAFILVQISLRVLELMFAP